MTERNNEAMEELAEITNEDRELWGYETAAQALSDPSGSIQFWKRETHRINQEIESKRKEILRLETELSAAQMCVRAELNKEEK